MPTPSCQQGGKRLLLKLELTLSSSDSSGRVVGRKGLTMGGFFKVLLGGALGAVLGIMFMKKQRAVKPDQSVQRPVARREPEPAPPPVAPVVPAASVAAPVAPEVVPPVAAAAVAPAVAAPSAPEPVVVVPAVPEPAIAIAPEPVVVPEPTPAPMPVPESVPAPTAVLLEPAEPPVTPAVVPAAAVAAVVAAEVPAPAEALSVVEAPPSEPAESHPVTWLAGAAVAGAAAAEVVEAAPAEAVEPEAVEPEAVEPEVAEPEVAEPEAVEPEIAEPEVAVVPPVLVAPLEAVEPSPPIQAAPEAPVYMNRVPSFVEAEAVAATVAAPETPSFEETTLSAEASEVLVTPELLEEPLPGAGWEPSAVFVQEEVELEELLPVVSDDVQPYEAPLITPEEGTDEAWDAAGWPEAAPAAAVGSAFAEEEPVPEWAAVVPFAAARVDEAPGEPELAVGFEPEVESEVIAEPAVGAQVQDAAEVVGAAEPTTEAAVGEDLRSRIEETRRRIREELEKPFAAVDEESPAVTQPPVAPVAAGAAATVIGEPMQTTVPSPRDGATAFAASAEASDEDASDYDAMRARIELTRSRLKAKAFDAMMAGESSLLGRDLEGSSTPTGPTASFDSEIEQTVDSTLREEDQ
jgi:hypothetical protein